MITRHDASAEEFEKYRLVVDFRDDCTLQTVHDSSSNLTSVQTWNRKKELGDGAFSEVWQEESKDEYGDWQYRAVKVCSLRKLRAVQIDYKRELVALAAFSESKVCFLPHIFWPRLMFRCTLDCS